MDICYSKPTVLYLLHTQPFGLYLSMLIENYSLCTSMTIYSKVS